MPRVVVVVFPIKHQYVSLLIERKYFVMVGWSGNIPK